MNAGVIIGATVAVVGAVIGVSLVVQWRPVRGPILSPYGAQRATGTHRGVDLLGAVGEPVRSPVWGRVEKVQSPELWALRTEQAGIAAGAYVRIRSLRGNSVHELMHLQTTPVPVGAYVWPGRVVGTVGRTGVLTAPTHLHWQAKDGNGAWINPLAKATV